VDPQERIQTLVKPSVQVRIHLHQRYINDQERDAWFKACDVLVVPYRRIYNSGVLMMGLSYGKTVIASDLPANQEIIQNGINGYLFENGNPLDLAQNIIRLKHASSRPASESILNKLKVNHSWDILAQQMKPALEA
jgi:glycosyltransferase involved in cell wall biosynthesis